MCAAGNDTPLVTFDCTFVSVNHSPNVNVDVTDSGVKIDDNEDYSESLQKVLLSIMAAATSEVSRKRKRDDEENDDVSRNPSDITDEQLL